MILTTLHPKPGLRHVNAKVHLCAGGWCADTCERDVAGPILTDGYQRIREYGIQGILSLRYNHQYVLQCSSNILPQILGSYEVWCRLVNF